MNRSFKNFFSLLSISLALLSFVSCTHSTDHQYDNYVHEPVLTNIKGFDPATSASDLYTGLVMSQIYEGLMQYTYLERPVKTEPLLADGMPKISKDGKTYTFKIKHGVMFHDDPSFKTTDGKGRELESADFIYSWKRIADPKIHSDGFFIFDQKVKGMTEWRDEAVKSGDTDYTKPISGVSAPDKYTLVVELVKPVPQFLYTMTMAGSFVVPHEAVEAYGPEFINHPVGTGPYKFRSWTRNAQIVLDRNPNYHSDFYPTKGEEGDKAAGLLEDAGKKLPLNDGVIFTEAVESQPRWLSFRKGVYDWIQLPKDNYDAAITKDAELREEYKAQGVKLSKVVDPDTTFEGFNMDDPIVGKNKYLRQAISVASDSAKLISTFYNGHAIPAEGPIPPGVLGYKADLKDPYRQFNLEKAKELLKKAGYPNGEGLPQLTYETYSDTNIRQMVEFFQQQLAQIGIKLKINQNTWPEYLGKLKTRKAQIFGMAWSADYPDGENFLQLFYSRNASPGPNSSNYNNPEYDKLYEKASIMLESPAREALYQQMVGIVIEDCPYIFEAHRAQFILQQGWFKNYKRNLTILNYVKYYKIDQNAKALLQKKL
jgi:oligopeptide transport system substrate-binding protein